jgi:hypothetical protein
LSKAAFKASSAWSSGNLISVIRNIVVKQIGYEF